MGGSDRPQQKTVRKELLLKRYLARHKSEYFIETGFKPVSMKINNMMYEKHRKVIPRKMRGDDLSLSRLYLRVLSPL